MKIKSYLYIALLICTGQVSFSQDTIHKQGNVRGGKIIDGDTIPHITLEEVYVIANLKPNNWWQKLKYKRLINNIKKVYPYAKLARKKFQEMNEYYLSLKTDKEKRQYMNGLEKELMDEFGDELKQLSISQGRLLLKLIDRETGHTSYEILKDYKGSVSAFFWQ